MVKLLSRFFFIFFFFAAHLTCAPAWAQANNFTPLYFGCVAGGYDPDLGPVCVRWAPTTGANPPDPYATFLGYIKTVQEPGTVELYWFCAAYDPDSNCVQWRAWPPGPHYGNDATLIGYVKTEEAPATVWLWENCVAHTNEGYCTRWGLADSPAPPSEQGALQLGYIYTTPTPPPPPPADDCSRAGLTMCVSFEAAPDTQFGGTIVTSRNMSSTPMESTLQWNVENASTPTPDSATDANRIALFPSSGRDGSSSIRLQTLDNDRDVHNSGAMERSEISLLNTDTQADANMALPENWWAHSLFVPVESTLPSTEGSQVGVFQFHGTPSAGDQPNFILQIRNQEAPQAHLVFRAYTAGVGGDPSDGTQYTYNIIGGPTRKGQCIFDDFQKGHWYDFVHHIRWSYTGAGSHEIWMRKDNGPVTKVLQKTNINTLWMNDTAYLKLGLYHDPVVGANTSVIHDRIRRGSSPDAVRMPDFTVDLNASVTPCVGTN